jgi:DNA polymerase kappa
MSMLSTASYDARKFGVRSGMPGAWDLSHPFRSQLTGLVLGFIAKKLCPDLIMVNHHFDQYMDVSRKIMDIFREYDPNMFTAGCDEGYLKYAVVCLRSYSPS